MSRQSIQDKNNDKGDWQSNNYAIGRRMHTIMSIEDASNGKKSFWPELEITGTISNISPALFKMRHLTSLYLNDNNISEVPAEISYLSSLTHLDLSCNKLRQLPAELGDLRNLKDLLLGNNYLRCLPYELGKLYQLNNLGLKGNPLAPEILGIYNEPNGIQRLLSYLLDNLVVITSLPPARPWITLSASERSHNHPTCVFTVMCYNVLCDKYATRQLYGYCPNWALAWDYRRKGIMEEIKHYSADIICLQEVETEQFYDFFLPELRQDGYEGIFSPKSRAKTMSKHERKHVDGCAIFYRTSKFGLIRQHLFEFNQLAMANAEGSDHMLNRVMTKDNIGLAALLQTKENVFSNGRFGDYSHIQQPVLVCTAHIHWDPEFCDVKLIQTMMLMHELHTIAETANTSLKSNNNKKGGNGHSNIPLVLCGDFNSLPDSGVYDFLSTGRIPTTHTDFKGLGYKDCLHKISCSERHSEYTHHFKVESAYRDAVMPYTNYTYDFKGIIDYIFISKMHMNTLGLLGPLDIDWLAKNKIMGVPYPHISSDHFSLLAEIELSPPSTVANGITSSYPR